MRLLISCLSVLLLHTVNVNGQSDQKAINILDSFSTRATGAPSVTMKFQLVNADQMENTTDTITGSIILSRDKYRLDLEDNITWYNGETVWNYLPAEKELTITTADKKDNSFQNQPSSIFTVYKKGYKCRLTEEKSELYTIDLFPEEISSELVGIRLLITKPLLNLKRLEYKRKDGIILTLNVIEYNLKNEPASNSFIFQKEKFGDVEIIDMR